MAVEVSVRDAAARMGVSPQRIRSLARGGRIPARKIGRDWAIEIDQLSQGGPGRSAVGRPLSARSSWAILQLLDGRQPGGRSRSELARARARLAGVVGMAPGELAARAEVHRLVVHRGMLDRLGNDPRVVLGGVSAAAHHNADLVSLEELEGYVREGDLEGVISDYALVSPPGGVRANVVLRVPVPDWPFEKDQRVASASVVAVDLVDARDERSVRAGRALLADCLQDVPA
ncbi:MAG: helix-turn-helix domain-containing protein [Thermoleophilia bacterium]|nr:helix-turn-helix domain-containing protein [Thermoleophilia bacterium]